MKKEISYVEYIHSLTCDGWYIHYNDGDIEWVDSEVVEAINKERNKDD